MFKYAKEKCTFNTINGFRMKWVSDFINLLYPNTCKACDGILQGDEKTICINCIMTLPYSTDTREVEQRFWGKLPIKEIITLLKFSKQGKVQTLLHRLKYKNSPEIGELLGEMIGQKIQKEKIVIDLLIPIPMHPEKQKQRGYNQAEQIAIGIENQTGIKMEMMALIKSKQSISQTKKSREERSKNVENLFELINPDLIKDKTVGLVDDVLTTGATLEACGRILLNAGAKEISLITIAATV
jgi:ComF family protein